MTEQTQGGEGLIVPDFSEVQDQVSPGIYKVRIVDSKMDKWTGKEGKPDTTLVVWTAETYGEAEEKNNGRKIFHRTPIQGPGAFRLQQFYKAAMGEDLQGGFDRLMLHGREVEVTIVDGKDKQGQLTGYTEIKAVKPVKASH